jgi:hypothetical protein
MEVGVRARPGFAVGLATNPVTRTGGATLGGRVGVRSGFAVGPAADSVIWYGLGSTPSTVAGAKVGCEVTWICA